MAPKRSSHLDDPPAASSSEEEEEASSEEEEGSESEEDEEQESQKLKTSSLSSPTTATAATEKKNPSKKPDSSSGSESDAESSSDSEPGDANVKPIASKPMEETPKTKKPRSRVAVSAATTARASAKRPSESEVKDSKRAKKKGSEQSDGVLTQGEDESKKSGDDSKKLFQRLWSEDDEIVILKGMVDYAAKKGADPSADMNAFHDFIKKSVQIDFTKNQLSDKLRRLKKKYENNAGKKKFNPTKPHDEKVFELSKKIWGGEGGIVKSEQPKANGSIARSGQKGNSKTLASLKAELLSSAEALKEKIDIDQNASGSGSLIAFDKSFGALGLPDHVVKKGLDSISESKKAELYAKWEKIHIAELELFAKRTQLLSDQSNLILEALKSTNL